MPLLFNISMLNAFNENLLYKRAIFDYQLTRIQIINLWKTSSLIQRPYKILITYQHHELQNNKPAIPLDLLTLVSVCELVYKPEARVE